MREAKFSIDTLEGHLFAGYMLEETWNGWACPYFSFEQAKQIADTYNERGCKAWYNASADQFVFSCEPGEEGDTESFAALIIDGQKFYPIGAFSWIWEEAIR